MTSSAAAVRARGPEIASASGTDLAPLAEMVRDTGIVLVPLFGPTEERIAARSAAVAAAAPSMPLPDLTRFYRVEVPHDRLEEVAAQLLNQEHVDAAYVKPGAEPAQVNDMAPAAEEAPPSTPDFSGLQGYLNAAPGGIDARFAWTKTGGGGNGVRIIDVEGAWRTTHEDLGVNQGGVVGGTPTTDIGWRNHGTAVIGEFSGDRNTVGVTGISPEANVRMWSIFGSSSSAAIHGAADLLSAGDIILIELHRAGPRFNFAGRDDQRGYIAIEWWPDDLAAIMYAVAKGVIVVEAGGNGAENLDDALYNTPGPGFPASWSNPFRRSPVDSGAIVVGAGAPPSGNFGPDRSRLDFSNWGALIDAQGWGREVVSSGYGDLQGGGNEDLWYTRQFSGTSSASPIVVGACACVQGFLRGASRTPLTPAQMRSVLRTTGSPQQASPASPLSQRIGNRPDLKQAINSLTPKQVIKDIKDSKDHSKEKEVLKDTKDAKDFTKEKETIKDAKDAKDHTKEKESSKDVKDAKDHTKDKEIGKDAKDTKDHTKEKEIGKDAKDAAKEKEGSKDLKDHAKEKESGKDLKDSQQKTFDKQLNLEKTTDKISDKVSDKTLETQGGPGIDQRLASLEQAVAQLSHFIPQELRPDLMSAPLASEADAAAALSAHLQKEATDAKAAKDAKDLEKTRES
jgi:hypothetical protein